MNDHKFGGKYSCLTSIFLIGLLFLSVNLSATDAAKTNQEAWETLQSEAFLHVGMMKAEE